jgi:beta-galactosidase/beta-glucuronidase
MQNGKRKPSLGSRGYPRPQLVRERWTNLNGTWDFAIDADARWINSSDVGWDRTIQVPFAPETLLSKVHETGLFRRVWYRKEFDTPEVSTSDRVILHFGAVDYEATVWVNDCLAVRHTGGYTPFSADITDLLIEGKSQSVIVRADDDPADLAKPRGKQDWRAEPHSIWYYRTTGIWQTVWLEVVPATRIDVLRWSPDAVKWDIGIEVRLAGVSRDDLQLRVRLAAGDRVLADDAYSICGQLSRKIGLLDPGIDDYRNELLWSPEAPHLIDAIVELRDGQGNVIDRVASYTALRAVGALGNRIVLNGKPYQLRLVLDQGYWPNGGLTAPDDDALRRDVELVKAMGFNGVRKHQKIEDPRFLYWADHLGLLVWGEMPSAYRFSEQTVTRVTREWTDAILRDVSHPCIMAWVPLNESWAVPDLPDMETQRTFVRSLYYLTKTLDPTRLVIGNDGWEIVVSDLITIHDYDADADRLARRYCGDANRIQELLHNERPGHKVLVLPEFARDNHPILLTEFGGIAFSPDKARTWGYSRVEDADEFARHYYRICAAARSSPMLAGFCYTQFTDTYQEANGLLYMDRSPKFPIHEIAVATRGAWSKGEREIEEGWIRAGSESVQAKSRRLARNARAKRP